MLSIESGSASLIADVLLVCAALGVALYCVVLSRRLRRFNDLEKGVGGAVAVLSNQVDDMTRALETARTATQDSALSLDTMTERAEGVASRLELLVAAMHDLPVEEKLPVNRSKFVSSRSDSERRPQ